MREKIKTICCTCMVLILLPFVMTAFFQGIDAIPLGEGQSKMVLLAEQENCEAAGTVNQEAQEEQLNYILVGILANQIDAKAPKEAVKAQAVIARTEYYYARQQNQEIPQGRSEEEMHQIWSQGSYNENYNFLMDCVKTTQGQVLLYQGKPINAAYHAVSNGQTRTMAESTSQEGYDYLISVVCEHDVESSDYLHVRYLEKKELVEKLMSRLSDCQIKEETVMEQVAVQERDSADYVTLVKVGEQNVSGDSFREILELESDCFYLTESEGRIQIVTKGYTCLMA